MDDRQLGVGLHSRRRRLIVLAVINLVFWVVIAIAVGLLVSDRLDLGLETMVRKGQATVVSLWEHTVSRFTSGTATPTMVALATAPTQATVSPVGPETASQSQTTLGPDPAATSSPLPSATLTPIPGFRATHSPGASPTPTAPESVPQLTTQPAATPISRPLLLSDASFEDLRRLDDELARSAVGRAVQIRYSEATLNQELSDLVEGDPTLPYQSVQLDLKRDQVRVAGIVTILGFELEAEAMGRVIVRDCRPEPEVDSVSIASALAPGFVKEQIRTMFQEALAWFPSDHPLCIEQIILEEEWATIYGYRR